MNAQGLPKVGVLSIIAATVMFTAVAVSAGDKSSVDSGSLELKPKAVAQGKVDVKSLDEQVSHLEVVDSMGNAYLLIPIKTVDGKSSMVAHDKKIVLEYVHPYTEPINR